MAGPESEFSQSFFAKAGRTTGPEFTRQVSSALDDPCVKVILEAVHGHLLILNSNRQILAANADILEALGRDRRDGIAGLRAGEALNCVHFTEGPEGCGTSVRCRTCGAVLATLAAQRTQARATDDCRLLAYKDGNLVAMDYRVTASPLAVGSEQLVALVMVDVTSEKRREVLEQTFLHDVMNSLGGIEGWSRHVQEGDPLLVAQKILSLAETLKEEVVCHRTLLAAENGSLVVRAKVCHPTELLQILKNMFENHPVAVGKVLKVDVPAQNPALHTDRALLLRVMSNMIKNGFEAIEPAASVRAWFELRGDLPTFVVENPGVISENALPHIFERSFSTKASRGRGIGTYSMKLYGERFLKGTVGFECREGLTRFWICLPQEAARAAEGPPVAAAPAASPQPRSAKQVLFVEDDQSLHRLGKLFLERLGFRVVAFQNGAHAADAFRAAPDAFDLVLTDGCLPGLTGAELAKQIHKTRPGMRVILCTGGSDNCAADYEAQGFDGVVFKPFSLTMLAEKLREAESPR